MWCKQYDLCSHTSPKSCEPVWSKSLSKERSCIGTYQAWQGRRMQVCLWKNWAPRRNSGFVSKYSAPPDLQPHIAPAPQMPHSWAACRSAHRSTAHWRILQTHTWTCREMERERVCDIF